MHRLQRKLTSFTDWTSDIAPFLFIAGPTDPLFERFKKDFEFIPINELRLWEWPADNHAQPFTFLVSRAVDVRAWARSSSHHWIVWKR